MTFLGVTLFNFYNDFEFKFLFSQNIFWVTFGYVFWVTYEICCIDCLQIKFFVIPTI